GRLLRVTNNRRGDYSMSRRITKRRAFVALGVVAALVIASAAIAYFTSSGSGSGTASVGSSSPFTIATDAATGGPLLPGSGSENIAYHVTNSGNGTQNLSSTSVSVASDANGDVTHNGGSIAGCKASWLNASNN